MNAMRVVYHLALADFYERTRRYSFLLILAAVIYVGVLVNNGTLGMELGSSDPNHPWFRYRGELNSAWIGAMTVMEISLFLGLFGFYLVNDCITRDIKTGVGQIIATTPVSRMVYLLGKWISNFVVLSLLVLILAVAAVIMVLFQSETGLDLKALLMPFVVVALPYMGLIAALAVVFETVPWLRGALGNVVYFFIWVSLSVVLPWIGKIFPFVKDPVGDTLFSTSLHASASAAYPQDSILKSLSVGVSTPGTAIAKAMDIPQMEFRYFNWSGVDWTPSIIAGQWLWVAFGLGLILLSALWFARFDPSRDREGSRQVKPGSAIGDKLAALRETVARINFPNISPLVSRLVQLHPFLGVLFAELRLLLNGRRWWWWAMVVGLNVMVFTAPIEIAHGIMIPILWLVPLAIWSEMGNRERKNNTAQMVFSAQRPVLRQLPAAWLAGVLVTMLFCTGLAVFYLVDGDITALAGVVVGVVFVPTLALALGVFSSNSKIFEVVYMIWWFMGPVEKVSGLDFTIDAPQVYLLTAAGLLLLSALWRGRQVRV